MRDRSLLFYSVIRDSRLSQNLLKTRHWWVALINLLWLQVIVGGFKEYVPCTGLVSFSAQSEKKKEKFKYLTTLPLANASPSPAPDIFIACRGPRVM